MKKSILKAGKKYTFSDYFELNNPTEEIVGELGYSFSHEVINLPQSKDYNVSDVKKLQNTFYTILPKITINSEIAKREFLIAPIYSSNTNISVFHSADEFEIVRQQRTQFALIFARISEEFLTSGFEFGERFVVSVIQGFLLEEFPEAFDQIQIRRIGREEYELDA